MKKIFTLIGSVILAHAALAQCAATISAGAQVISEPQQDGIQAMGGMFWICGGGGAVIIGNNNTLYVEPEAVGSVIGFNNTIYSNGFVTASGPQGTSNTIYTHDAEMVIAIGDGDQQIVECPGGINFTYTNAPAGCSPTSGIAEMDAPVQLDISPNPVFDQLNILVDPMTRVLNVRIMDLNGRLVMEQQGREEMRMDVSTLKPGLFTTIVETDRGTLVRKVRKER